MESIFKTTNNVHGIIVESIDGHTHEKYKVSMKIGNLSVSDFDIPFYIDITNGQGGGYTDIYRLLFKEIIKTEAPISIKLLEPDNDSIVIRLLIRNNDNMLSSLNADETIFDTYFNYDIQYSEDMDFTIISENHNKRLKN